MIDPRQIATRILGAIDWQTEVSGFCTCPGEGFHTSANGKKDCRVNVDGAPTIFCFHASCAAAVAEANRRLRRALAGGQWAIALPGGNVLRSGDILQGDGSISRKGAQTQSWGSGAAVTSAEPQISDLKFQKGPSFTGGYGGQARLAEQERVILESLRVNAGRFKPELFDFFRWPMAEILEDSPLLVAERDAEDQFRTWLKLWPACSTVWIGDVCSSGKPEHRTHFRTVGEWYQIGPVMGNYTCGSAFRSGCFSRSNENLGGHRFMVVESDTLGHDAIGAVFAFLRRRLHYEMHCIIDTAGKSLHGWFEAPPNRIWENRLKAGLEAFGCDPKVFTYSQPVRVPGAWRNGKLQRLIWLKQ